MKKKQVRIIPLLLAIVLVSTLIPSSLLPNAASARAAGTKIYTIGTSDTPCNQAFTRYSTYNSHTRQYYLIRSYLEKLEAEGGGTLELKKGIYTVTNTLYVPSNVTIILKDGAVIRKGAVTKLEKMPASKSIFQFAGSVNAKKTGFYSGYEGDKNISLIGEGTAVIDINFCENAVGVIMGHNQNITIENICFTNMDSGHFIEMDASKNVTIRNCTFTGYQASSAGNKEAVNIDTPDKTTEGFSQKWSSFDCTPNQNVLIEGCIFYKLERAVGTHRYSLGKLHTGVVLKDNLVSDVRSGFFGLNWKETVMEQNTFLNMTEQGKTQNTGDGYGIFLAGTVNPLISDNTFLNCPSGAVKIRETYQTVHDTQDIISSVHAENAAMLKNNSVSRTKAQVKVTADGSAQNYELEVLTDKTGNRLADSAQTVIKERLALIEAAMNPTEVKVVAIDAGHQGKGNSEKEPIGPGASVKKAKVSSGTQGVSTKVPEYKLTLAVSLKLKEELVKRGYEVVMIRETHDVNISNSERAAIANDAQADVFLRIHANGASAQSASGATTLYPSKKNPYVAYLSADSKRLSEEVLSHMCEATGAKNRGASANDTMSGLNWSKVPVTIVEMGFMTNPAEDKKMQTESYQDKIVQGICDGVDAYFAE